MKNIAPPSRTPHVTSITAQREDTSTDIEISERKKRRGGERKEQNGERKRGQMYSFPAEGASS